MEEADGAPLRKSRHFRHQAWAKALKSETRVEKVSSDRSPLAWEHEMHNFLAIGGIDREAHWREGAVVGVIGFQHGGMERGALILGNLGQNAIQV